MKISKKGKEKNLLKLVVCTEVLTTEPTRTLGDFRIIPIISTSLLTVAPYNFMKF